MVIRALDKAWLSEYRGCKGHDGGDPRKVSLPHAQLQRADD